MTAFSNVTGGGWPENPGWLRQAHAAAFRERREGPDGARFRRQLLLHGAGALRVLLPHDGWPRGLGRYGRENCGDRIYAAASHEGPGGHEPEVSSASNAMKKPLVPRENPPALSPPAPIPLSCCN